MDLTLTIFVLVYVAMGVGHLPGFRLDRTGAATVGAMVLIASGEISPAAAWAAVDYRVIGLLFGLMTVSAAFMVAGVYDWIANKIGHLVVGPKGHPHRRFRDHGRPPEQGCRGRRDGADLVLHLPGGGSSIFR